MELIARLTWSCRSFPTTTTKMFSQLLLLVFFNSFSIFNIINNLIKLCSCACGYILWVKCQFRNNIGVILWPVCSNFSFFFLSWDCLVINLLLIFIYRRIVQWWLILLLIALSLEYWLSPWVLLVLVLVIFSSAIILFNWAGYTKTRLFLVILVIRRKWLIGVKISPSREIS